MPKYSNDWNLYQATFLGAFTGASYVLVMFTLSGILSVRGMSFALALMFVAAIAGATVALGVATLLNFVKRTERKRAMTLDNFTSTALAHLA